MLELVLVERYTRRIPRRIPRPIKDEIENGTLGPADWSVHTCQKLQLQVRTSVDYLTIHRAA